MNIDHPVIRVRFKKLDEKAVIPTRAHPTDAGLDLTAISMERDVSSGIITYGTGLAIEIPNFHVGLIFPRSSVFRTDLSLSNAVGVVDSSYRGEVKFKFRPTTYSPKIYEIGERVGQLIVMPYPIVLIEEVKELTNSDRGTGGWGSSGK